MSSGAEWPDTALARVAIHLPVTHLAAFACVCRHFAGVCRAPSLWLDRAAARLSTDNAAAIACAHQCGANAADHATAARDAYLRGCTTRHLLVAPFCASRASGDGLTIVVLRSAPAQSFYFLRDFPIGSRQWREVAVAANAYAITVSHAARWIAVECDDDAGGAHVDCHVFRFDAAQCTYVWTRVSRDVLAAIDDDGVEYAYRDFYPTTLSPPAHFQAGSLLSPTRECAFCYVMFDGVPFTPCLYYFASQVLVSVLPRDAPTKVCSRHHHHLVSFVRSGTALCHVYFTAGDGHVIEGGEQTPPNSGVPTLVSVHATMTPTVFTHSVPSAATIHNHIEPCANGAPGLRLIDAFVAVGTTAPFRVRMGHRVWSCTGTRLMYGKGPVGDVTTRVFDEP